MIQALSLFFLLLGTATSDDNQEKCIGLRTSWVDVGADKEFPVAAGTELTLRCKTGHPLTGDETVTCIKDTEFKFSVEPQCWLAEEKGVRINFDLESTPLELMTDNEVGSDEWAGLNFYTAGGDSAGDFRINFDSTIEYQFHRCSSYRNSEFPSTPPSTVDKTWRITKTRSAGIGIQMHCNDVEVLNVLLSDICTDESWSTYWSREAKKMGFPYAHYYRPYTEKCNSLKSSWTNMSANKKFPVATGTVLTLICNTGYQLQGQDIVTCTKETEFTTDGAEPKCIGCTGLKAGWTSSIRTKTHFPVVPGTVVKVTCSKSDDINKGSHEVTCNSGTSFNFLMEPSCFETEST